MFYLPKRGFEPQIFSNFPAHDLNFHEREGDEIKSKQASKRDRTLTSYYALELNLRKMFTKTVVQGLLADLPHRLRWTQTVVNTP